MMEPEERSTLDTDIDALPNELLAKILVNLKQNDAAHCRCVSRKWQNVVNENYKFYVFISQHKLEGREEYQPERLRSCTLSGIDQDVHITFQNPHLLKKLRFWGTIHPHIIARSLKQANALNNLQIAHFGDCKDVIIPKEPLNLPVLTTLKICDTISLEECEAQKVNIMRLLSHDIPFLQDLTVSFRCKKSTSDEVLTALFDFLFRHRKTLKALMASIIPLARQVVPEKMILSASKSRDILPVEIKHLLYHDPKFQLKSLDLKLPTRYQDLWDGFIQNQRELANLTLTSAPNNWERLYQYSHYSGILLDNIMPLLVVNATTLVKVELTDLKLERHSLDAGIFKEMGNLETFILKRNREEWKDFSQREPSFTNLKEVPRGKLKVLAIGGFICDTDELEALIEEAPKLKHLTLNDNGKAAGQGVNGRIIKNFVKREGIDQIDVYPVSHFNKLKQKRMLKKVRKWYPEILRDSIYCPRDHVFFDFNHFREKSKQK